MKILTKEALQAIATAIKENPMIVLGCTCLSTLTGAYHLRGTYHWEEYKDREIEIEKKNTEEENTLKLKAEEFEKNKMTQQDLENFAKNQGVDPKKLPKNIAARYIVEEEFEKNKRDLRFKTDLAQFEYQEKRNKWKKLEE